MAGNKDDVPREAGEAAAQAAGHAVAGSKTVERTLGLLKLVASAPSEGLRLMDLAEQSGLDRSTTYRLMSSLVRFNFVDQDSENKRYALGLEFFALAAAAANRHDLSARARTALEDLSRATGDTITYCLRSGHDLICVDVETGRHPLPRLPMDIGSRRPVGAGATGVALLATLPDYEVDEVLTQQRERLLRRHVDIEDVRRAVTECREIGHALMVDAPGGKILGLAIPLIARNGRPIGTLTINGEAERFVEDRVAGLAALLREQARRLHEELSVERERNRRKDNRGPAEGFL